MSNYRIAECHTSEDRDSITVRVLFMDEDDPIQPLFGFTQRFTEETDGVAFKKVARGFVEFASVENSTYELFASDENPTYELFAHRRLVRDGGPYWSLP